MEWYERVGQFSEVFIFPFYGKVDQWKDNPHGQACNIDSKSVALNLLS